MVGLGGILGMGLYITHFMVPPTPARWQSSARSGKTVWVSIWACLSQCGIGISIPLFAFAVPLFRHFGKKYPNLVVPYEIDCSQYSEAQLRVLDRINEKYQKNEDLVTEDFADLLAAEKLPSAFMSFATLLVPIVLIFANTLVGQISSLQGTMVANVVQFLGQPVIALFISLCMGAFLLCKGLRQEDLCQSDAGGLPRRWSDRVHHCRGRRAGRGHQRDRRCQDDGGRDVAAGVRHTGSDHHRRDHAFPAGFRVRPR